MGKARSAVVTLPFIPKSSFIGTILMVANSFNIINETSLKPSQASFLISSFQQKIVNMFIIKSCRSLDSNNHGPLVSEFGSDRSANWATSTAQLSPFLEWTQIGNLIRKVSCCLSHSLVRSFFRSFAISHFPSQIENLQKGETQLSPSVTKCWNKKLPKFFKNCRKSSHSIFYLKSSVFLNSPRSHQMLWLLL